MPENIKQHAKNDSSNHFSCLGGKKWTCITFSKKKKKIWYELWDQAIWPFQENKLQFFHFQK